MQGKHFERAHDRQLGSVLGQLITAFSWALGMTGLRRRQGRERWDHLPPMGVDVCL